MIEAKDFDAEKAQVDDKFVTSDGKVFKVVPVDVNELPEPEYWACVYKDQDGVKWARFFNSQAEHDAFMSANNYESVNLVKIESVESANLSIK